MDGRASRPVRPYDIVGSARHKPGQKTVPHSPAPLGHLAAELLACLRFYTRLPIPEPWFEAAHRPEPFSRVLRWAPLAGLVVGSCGAAAMMAATLLGLPPLVSGALALASAIVVGGGLHEDGLADMADGFGGGSTTARKLEIMRDSRLGTYGAIAVCMSLLLRAAAVAALIERSGTLVAVAGFVAASAASRGIGLLPMALLPPARRDGLAHAAGELGSGVFPTAWALASGIGIALPTAAGDGLARPLTALALATVASFGTAILARRQIGGHTGDVAGAAQQFCEGAFLIGLLVGPVPR
jgi:adenosylcobinamide-GDP ribazoletransferase